MARHRSAVRRYGRTADRAVLDEAATRLADAHLAGRISAVRYAALLNDMGIHYGNRFEATGAAEDSDRALSVGLEALRALPCGHSDRGLYLSNYAADLGLRYDRFGDPAVLDEAIERLEEGVGVTPENSPRRATMLSNLSLFHRMRFDARAGRDDLERAVTLAVRAAEATAPGDPNRSKHLYNAGVVHRLRFEVLGGLDDLDTALRHGSAAVRAAPDPKQRARALSGLGSAHRARFARTGDPADLDAAIRAGVDAVRCCPRDDHERATYVQNVGVAFGARYERTGDVRDLDAATWHADEALRSTPADSPDRLPRLLNVGVDHLRRFERRGDLADLDLAIDRLGAAVRRIPPETAEFATYLTNLANAHSARFDRTGDLADLDIACAHEQRALDLTPRDHVDLAMRLSNVAAGRLRRHARHGDLADLDAALAASTEAVRATPTGATALPKRLLNLGYAHRARYERAGSMADLDAAVRCGLDAVAACPPGATYRADCLSALGFAHLARSVPLGADGDDLDSGFRHLASALAATAAGHPDHAGRLADLAIAHRLRFRLRGDPADLDEAIRLGASALRRIPPDHPVRAGLHSIQSDAFYERFRLAGPDRDADAAAMVDLAAEAVRLTADDHADRARRLADLGETYRARAGATGAVGDVVRAVGFLSRGVAGIPADHPGRAERLVQLARAHLAGHRSTGGTADRGAAVGLLQEAATASSALPARRLEAARLWGDTCAANGDAAGAADAYATAVGLLPLLAWRGLGRGERESRLRSNAGLASLATAWAIEAGRVEAAVELLEQGRAVLWAQTLQTRRDLTDLRAVRPDLADLLTTLRARLDGYEERTGIPLEMVRPQPTDDRERLAAGHRRDVETWETAVGQVRALVGFRTFLAPTPFTVLREAAADGPVVLVNVSGVRCDALIVAHGKVRLVPLPDLHERECAERAAGLSRLVDRSARSDRDLAPQPAAPALTGLLGWLWDTVCAPVLAALDGPDDPPPDRSAPRRLWWCPTGMLSALPLHAAGRYGTPDAVALPDLAVSSYTSTLSALKRARSADQRRVDGGGRPVVLAVGMPTTPPIGDLVLADLPGVSDELDRLGRRFACLRLRTATRRERERATTVSADRLPTVERVRDALSGHAWVHLACHGGQDPDDPSSGAVYLADGPLTVLRIAALDLRAAELAFLSACRTAVGGVELRDESIHLAAAMQVAGYRHVVATAWSISDEHTPEVVDRTYSRLMSESGAPDVRRCARALHHAVAALRAELPDRPDLWAAYLHVGP